MDPVIGASLISSIPSVAKLGLGIRQGKQADEYEKVKRPTYRPPRAAKNAVNVARNLAGRTRIPGAEIYENKLSAKTASALETAKNVGDNPSDILGTLDNVYATEMGGLLDLGIADGNFTKDNQRGYQSALNNFARYQDKAFELNHMEPYENSMAAASALRGSSIKNKFSGLSDLSGVLGTTSAAMISKATQKKHMDEMKKFLENLFAPEPEANPGFQESPLNIEDVYDYEPSMIDTLNFG